MSRRLFLFLRCYCFDYFHRCLRLQSTQSRHLVSKLLSSSCAPFLISTCTVFAYKHATRLKVLAKDAVSDDMIIEEADRLYNNGHIRNLYVYLKSYSYSKNSEILWRLARAARDLAIKGTDVAADEKKRLVYEAFDFSKQALDEDDSNFAAHKWFAITIGDVGDYEGVKVKISNAYVIRDHLEQAAELNPKDATTQHCLGMWCYVFADMPRWQHTIAGWIFATPPTSSFQEAAKYFSEAERVDPNFYSVNLLMLGKTYMKMGDKKRAMLYFDLTRNYNCVNKEDEEAKTEAEKLLKEVIESK